MEPINDCIAVGPWRGEEGTLFKFKGAVTEFHIVYDYGIAIGSVTVKATNHNGRLFLFKMGGNGGGKTATVYFDDPAEHVMLICGTYGKCDDDSPVMVRSLTFVTNCSIYGPYGCRDGTPFFSPVSVGEIVGFHGRSGKYLNAIGFFMKPLDRIHDMPFNPKLSSTGDESVVSTEIKQVVPREPGPWGGSGGCPWDDGVFSGVKQIIVHRGEDAIYSIVIEYDKNGESVWSPRHGGLGGNTTNRIRFNYPTETLIGISGYYGFTKGNENFVSLSSLSFHTNKGKYGPVGEEIGIFFTSSKSSGKVVGFHGKSGSFLDAIGIHMEYS